MYDVIVIGARCAGAATAMLLARKGHKVLLLDRAHFPSEIPHGHFIHRHGPQRLKRWGLLESIIQSNCPPVSTMTMDAGDFPLVGTDLVTDGAALGYGPRRKILDTILVEAAVDAGAEFRPGFLAEDYLSDGPAIAGIRGRSLQPGGSVCEERARITVGADGRHSPLARAVQAPVYEATPPLACWYFTYFGGVAVQGLEIYIRNRSVIFAFPTNNGMTAIFIGWDISQFDRVRSEIDASFTRALESAPDLGERVREGRREERFYGAADLPNFYRKPYGPGWALVGDAGVHKDPFLALGVCDAFRDAELLASAIDEGLSGKQPVDESLAAYERARNSASLPDYRQNIQFARFDPLPADFFQLRAAIRGNQEDINRFYMARQGMIPPEEFFNPENMQRLMRRASAKA